MKGRRRRGHADKFLHSVVNAALMVACGSAQAADQAVGRSVDLAAGKAKFEGVCFQCHGANGVSPNPLWPNLAGQKLEYLRKQIKDFRGGQRFNELMTPQAKQLTEKEIEDVTAYVSSLPCGPAAPTGP